jgi:hypothetical protein
MPRNARTGVIVPILVATSVWFVGSCNDSNAPPTNASLEGRAQIVFADSDRDVGNDQFSLRSWGKAVFSEAKLQATQMVLPFPDDTAYEICISGENCKEQGKTWTGQFYVHCLDGVGQCGSNTFTWNLSSDPPGASVSFDPTTTNYEDVTTLTIELDDDAETGVFHPTVTAPPSPGSLDLNFHTLCNWGLDGCPYGEILDMTGAGHPSISVSAAGEQDALIGDLTDMKVQWKVGTGDQQYQQQAQQWLVERDGTGLIVDNYDINTGQLTYVSQSEGTQNEVNYYHASTDRFTVWAQADLSYDNDEARVRVLTKAVYNVDGPTNINMTSSTRGVEIGYDSIHTKALHFGHNAYTAPGISWTFTADAPSGDDNGYVSAVQRINYDANKTNVSGNQYYDDHTNGYMLDGCRLDVAATQPDGGSYESKGGDSPSVPIDSATDSIVSANFDAETYFMYRPAGTSSIWVPLGELDWHWDGVASKQSGAWVPTSAHNSNDPSGVASSVFPLWSEVKNPQFGCSPIPSFSAANIASSRREEGSQ